MAINVRIIDSLSEAHLMAVSQGKKDIAKLLLKAIEIEQDKYGAAAKSKNRRSPSTNMLAVAKQRQAAVIRQFDNSQK